MDGSMDILCTESEYDILKSNIALLEKDLESKNQQIYDFKKQIAVATALEGDYLQEIEMLQSNNNVEVMQLQRTVKELEEDNLGLRNSSNLELLRNTELIDSLQSEIKEVSKNNISKDEQNEEKILEGNRDVEKNLKLKAEMTVLNANLVAVQTSIDNIKLQNANLEGTNNELLMELDHAEQNMKCKMQELIETKNLIHNLQEDSVFIELELESMKNKPLDAVKKGNSLFAEVEDSRIKTQQNIQQLKKKYAELKRDLCNKVKQMTAVRAQNTELCHQLNGIKNSHEEYEKVIEEYKIKVAALESAIEECKQEFLKEQKFTSTDLSTSAVEFANGTLKAKWNTAVKLSDELNRESKKKLETFINIKNANTEMRDWRRKGLQLKTKLEKLETTILAIELQSSPTNKPTFETLLGSPEKEIPTSSVPRCSEIKSDSTNENHANMSRSTITIRKKSVLEDKCIVEQEQ